MGADGAGRLKMVQPADFAPTWCIARHPRTVQLAHAPADFMGKLRGSQRQIVHLLMASSWHGTCYDEVVKSHPIGAVDNPIYC
jgi:hypothetical protein